jgi:hypothetical protein
MESVARSTTVHPKHYSTAEIENIWTPKLQRIHDKCIMDVLRECHDTARINRVRIYLQATTIADVKNAEGTHILRGQKLKNE